MRLPARTGLYLALSIVFAAGPAEAARKPVIGMANPASVHCGRIGGHTTIRKDKAGNAVGYCRLPDGRVCEEWALFRDTKCVRQKRR